MANVIGLGVRRPGEDPEDPEDGGTRERLIGPLHAVEGTAGRAAAESSADVQALCGAWVQVVPVEDVPDDTGLCGPCQYG